MTLKSKKSRPNKGKNTEAIKNGILKKYQFKKGHRDNESEERKLYMSKLIKEGWEKRKNLLKQLEEIGEKSLEEINAEIDSIKSGLIPKVPIAYLSVLLFWKRVGEGDSKEFQNLLDRTNGRPAQQILQDTEMNINFNVRELPPVKKQETIDITPDL